LHSLNYVPDLTDEHRTPLMEVLRPQHLLDCLNSADSAAKAGLIEALLTLVTSTSSGRLHPRVDPYLCAARLIPLRKKDGGVRPIAVGDTLRRLLAK